MSLIEPSIRPMWTLGVHLASWEGPITHAPRVPDLDGRASSSPIPRTAARRAISAAGLATAPENGLLHLRPRP